MKKKIGLIIFFLTLVVIFFPGKEEVYLKPLEARDSDGTPSDEILENMEKCCETVILKFNPYGYLEVKKWGKVNFPKKAFAVVKWRTYEDLGAGNIYIGYSFDGKNYEEVGPFGESKDLRETILEIPVNFFSDLSDLRIRFRGEDLDFATDAIAEVNIKLKVIRYRFGLLL
ncbi:MAG: hypothetical protein QXG39_00705 [Candidatus Aenigmatarchaeota archaeon]